MSQQEPRKVADKVETVARIGTLVLSAILTTVQIISIAKGKEPVKVL